MTLRKITTLLAAALIVVTGTVHATVTKPMHVTIEYEYAKDGEIVSRKINGEIQRYEYDLRGQLTGVYDDSGKAVEAYTYDAAGNILKKTLQGKTTTFTYDGANQLVSKHDDSGLTAYEYDAAGRMIREGDKEYRYSYLDKITSVIENGETAATMDYFIGGQLASVTRGLDTENFVWDGLALVHRDGSDYLNEPAVGGGNPVASDGKVMFNDMLGSTVAVRGEEGYSMTSMTAFGESSDSGAFFTGKPFIGELGYAFLMRSYRPENGKWQTADPMGYPDGWNQLAYCNNHVMSSVDLFGASSYDAAELENRWTLEDDPVPFSYFEGSDYIEGLARIIYDLELTADETPNGYINIATALYVISAGTCYHYYAVEKDDEGYISKYVNKQYSGSMSLYKATVTDQKTTLLAGNYVKYTLTATFFVEFKLSGDGWFNTLRLSIPRILEYTTIKE